LNQPDDKVQPKQIYSLKNWKNFLSIPRSSKSTLLKELDSESSSTKKTFRVKRKDKEEMKWNWVERAFSGQAIWCLSCKKWTNEHECSRPLWHGLFQDLKIGN
jgi:hypothetical protein